MNEIRIGDLTQHQIGNYTFEVGRSNCGDWYALLTREPFFCFHGQTKEDALSKAQDTFAEYAKMTKSVIA